MLLGKVGQLYDNNSYSTVKFERSTVFYYVKLFLNLCDNSDFSFK